MHAIMARCKEKNFTHDTDTGSTVMEKNLQISFLLDFYGELLSPRQREITDSYYNNDLSLGEISANTGITRQAVRDIVKRTELALFEMEEKLGLCSRFESMQSGLAKIEEHARTIQAYNKTKYQDEIVSDNITQILSTANNLQE